jgi:hypothetical protein
MTDYVAETKVIGKYRIDIISDDDPEDPRGWDNLGTMVCFHRRYNLGDKHNFDEPSEARDFLKDKKARHIVLPLYLYDHSGITMNTTGFSCPWDSGQVGWIYITREKVRKEYGCKRVTKKMVEKIKGYLRNEVETYDQYLTGDVYGFRITDEETEEEMDSCWGFFGEKYCMEEAESIVKHLIENEPVKSV